MLISVWVSDLAQRPGSAVTVGVAVYILSLPDGAVVSIAALCAHFSEGEILISRALRELEAAGYLERRRQRGPGGRIRTRTYFHDVPVRSGSRDVTLSGKVSHSAAPAPWPQRIPPQHPVRDAARDRGDALAPARPEPSPTSQPASSVPPPCETQQEAEADERAAVILASLRIVDSRLILSQREVAEPAPAVTRRLTAGVSPAQITEALTTRPPARLLSRPAGILTYRLNDPPPAAPAPAASPARPPALPWQTCDGCERAFRAAEPTLCRDCLRDNSSAHRPRAA
ncbi:hypothetical protein [Streptomyces sp. KR55]|uniref:hypothetical protein n=1 Tax=Streptomyces sp. KR55 TaxID=3457425 RepID=UPI003FD586A5